MAFRLLIYSRLFPDIIVSRDVDASLTVVNRLVGLAPAYNNMPSPASIRELCREAATRYRYYSRIELVGYGWYVLSAGSR